MKMHFCLFTLVLLLASCEGKKYQKSDNSSVAVVESLNKSNPEEVIQKLTVKENLSPRERYYLASAQSQMGGIDVFSLYPILELQLFHKNALDWSDISKEKNPYLKFMKGQEGLDVKKRQEKREARWAKYEEKVILRKGLKLTKPTLEVSRSRYDPYNSSDKKFSEDIYSEADLYLEAEAKKVFDTKPSDESDLWTAWDKVGSVFTTGKEWNPVFYDLYNYHGDVLKLKWLKHKYLFPEEFQGSILSGVKWEMVYMNVLWNTYEAIPMLQKLPTLTEEHQNHLTTSLDNYFLLLKNPEFKEPAKKQLSILLAISILSYYKNSFDFEEVNGMQDLLCSFDPTPITDNYGMIRKRLLLMVKIAEEVGTEMKGFEDFQKHAKEAESILPEELSEESKTRYIEGVERFKISTCFEGNS